MKKFMFLLMALPAICLCTACSDGDDEASGIAETPTAKGDHFDGTLYYRITSHTDRQAAVCGAAESAVSIEIPAVVAIDGTTYQCTAIDPEAFANHSKLEQAALPATVATIGYRAFSDCTQLSAVSLPNGLTNIGYRAFTGCTRLSAVSIPASVSAIGYRAFAGCSSLGSIQVAADNPVYDSRRDCNAIIESKSGTLIVGCAQTTIPDNITAIGDEAFCNCLNLRSVRIPKSVLTIGNYTFEGCRNLASVTISDNATIIGDGAFYQCSGLASVAIPAKVTSVGSYAFAGCSGLKTIYSQNTTPPEARTYAFDQATTQNATLHVPSGSRTAYTQAPVWRNFIHIN